MTRLPLPLQRVRRTGLATACVVVCALAGEAAAQDTVAVIPPVAAAPVLDSLRPPVAPLPAFFRSLVLPGWGQAILNRRLTGGLFMIWEGVTLSMTLKAHREVQFLRRTEHTRVPEGSTDESSRLRSKKSEREDWMVLLAFNHLFSGLEAYVGAHLWDFPTDMSVRMVPVIPGGGGPGVAVSIPFRIR